MSVKYPVRFFRSRRFALGEIHVSTFEVRIDTTMPRMFWPPECCTPLPYVEFCRNSETQIHRSCLGEPCSRTRSVSQRRSRRRLDRKMTTRERRLRRDGFWYIVRADRPLRVRKRLRVSKNKDFGHPRYIFISNCEKNIYHIPLATNNPINSSKL